MVILMHQFQVSLMHNKTSVKDSRLNDVSYLPYIPFFPSFIWLVEIMSKVGEGLKIRTHFR